jgi:hypothetical protein
MEDLLTAWLDEVEGKLVQAFAGDNPPPTLDGAMVIVQDEVKYKEVDKTETDPETGEEETVKVYEPYVLDRWVLFVAKQVP